MPMNWSTINRFIVVHCFCKCGGCQRSRFDCSLSSTCRTLGQVSRAAICPLCRSASAGKCFRRRCLQAFSRSFTEFPCWSLTTKSWSRLSTIFNCGCKVSDGASWAICDSEGIRHAAAVLITLSYFLWIPSRLSHDPGGSRAGVQIAVCCLLRGRFHLLRQSVMLAGHYHAVHNPHHVCQLLSIVIGFLEICFSLLLVSH